MEYASVQEIAKKWGVTSRQVQRLLCDNRVEGAKRYGKVWLIPIDAIKPIDKRKNTKAKKAEYFSCGFLITKVPFYSKDTTSVINSFVKETERKQIEGEIAYFKGDFVRARQCYYDAPDDDPVKLCACAISLCAATCLMDYDLCKEIKKFLDKVKYNNEKTQIIVEMIEAMIYISVAIPDLVPKWLKEGNFDSLPADASPFVTYLYLKYLLYTKQYKSLLDAANMSLLLLHEENNFYIMNVYFRFLKCCGLGIARRTEEVDVCLDKILSMTLPFGYYSPICECINLLAGQVEMALKTKYAEYYDVVMDQFEKTWKNWFAFHNHYAHDNVSLILTIQEYRVAQLLVLGMTYKEISARYFLSINRIKDIVLSIYNKLGINKKRDLSMFIV